MPSKHDFNIIKQVLQRATATCCFSNLASMDKCFKLQKKKIKKPSRDDFNIIKQVLQRAREYLR